MDEVSRCCPHARVLASPIFHLRVFFFALTCDEQMLNEHVQPPPLVLICY